MRKDTLALLTALLLLVPFHSVLSAPRPHNNIVGSNYYRSHEIARMSLMKPNRYIYLKNNGYWKQVVWRRQNHGSSSPGDRVFDCRPECMDRHIIFSVPLSQTERLWINGMEITPLTHHACRAPEDDNPSRQLPLSHKTMLTKCNASEPGRIDNNRMNVVHCHHVWIFRPGWGDENLLHAMVGYFNRPYVDAENVNSYEYIFATDTDQDLSFHATPEPGTLSLLGIGLLGMIPFLRTRRK
jgi:hypothetical protein